MSDQPIIPKQSRTPDVKPPRQMRGGHFIRYRYSYRCMSSANGQTHVRGKETRYENGQLETEEFEGTLEGDLHSHAMEEVQSHFSRQMALFFRPFAAFLPFWPYDRNR